MIASWHLALLNLFSLALFHGGPGVFTCKPLHESPLDTSVSQTQRRRSVAMLFVLHQHVFPFNFPQR